MIAAIEDFVVSKGINYVYITSSQNIFVLPNLPILNIYLIYTGLMAYTTLNLVYSKEYVYYIPLTCSMILLF